MLLAFATAIGVFGLLSLPGWILAAGRPNPIWVCAAAGFCSQFAIILFAAMISIAMPAHLDVRLVLPVAAFLSVAAFVYGRREPLSPPTRPEAWAFVVPLVAMLAVALIT